MVTRTEMALAAAAGALVAIAQFAYGYVARPAGDHDLKAMAASPRWVSPAVNRARSPVSPEMGGAGRKATP